MKQPPGWLDPAPEHPGAQARVVRMRDGVPLATDVYLPEPLPGRIPAVLVRTCYDKNGTELDAPGLAAHLAQRGYALVVQDVRGTYRSSGEQTPWLNEAGDAFDTIDWVVRQTWCDERVVMMGNSYLGFTQWAAVASGHPGLRAIAPQVASQRIPDDWFDAHTASAAGASWLARWWSGPGRLTGDGLDWDTRPFLDAIPPELTNARRLHREFLSFGDGELHAAIYPGPLPAARITIPALHTGGWFDPFGSYQLGDWTLVSNRSPAAGDQFLVMAAEDHDGAAYPGSPDADDTHAQRRAAHVTRALDFFDRCLRGCDATTAPPPRVRYEIAGAGWRTAQRWPPAGITEQRLYLSGITDGTLGTSAGASEKASWVHDPADPVPATVTSAHADGHGITLSERDLHARGDVLTFTAPPAEQPFDLVGPVALDATVSSTAPSMHLIATLCDIGPDGDALRLLEGITRLDTRYGSSSATVHLGTTAYRVQAGHRLRLVLACSRHPRYLVHPGTDDNLWTAAVARRASQTITLGGAGGGCLRLSILAGV